ncbi:poly-gamma-glutamate hydrolase family protein [Lysobacter sp. ISL-42]|nr:poly-gamma-glutamate hydrolase family protein [Lysobacter sp. ISL-42]MBT2752364.1 poly-gamma-glutamate hydrolase family protein [Lysobacter sp. ISL-50]MBT2776217.1 poly-gamma-glutamate hydrolase family protein [Lysobacter sp. ISL-54]MBT2784301.1 poly-gamma-glutamate hydrolase family protein [Lysobacter sp. ISL-52]
MEPGTSPLARGIAGADYSVYLFEGLKAEGNGVLHVTSHRFSEPRCLEMLALAHTVVAIHGCSGDARICVGGLDKSLAALLTTALIGASYPAIASGHEFPARRPANICNRGSRGMGAQLEISGDLRTPEHINYIATAVRQALAGGSM